MHNFREISCPKLQLIDFSVGRDAAMGQSEKVTELMPKGASVNKEEEAKMEPPTSPTMHFLEDHSGISNIIFL